MAMLLGEGGLRRSARRRFAWVRRVLPVLLASTGLLAVPRSAGAEEGLPLRIHAILVGRESQAAETEIEKSTIYRSLGAAERFFLEHAQQQDVHSVISECAADAMRKAGTPGMPGILTILPSDDSGHCKDTEDLPRLKVAIDATRKSIVDDPAHRHVVFLYLAAHGASTYLQLNGRGGTADAGRLFFARQPGGSGDQRGSLQTWMEELARPVSGGGPLRRPAVVAIVEACYSRSETHARHPLRPAGGAVLAALGSVQDRAGLGIGPITHLALSGLRGGADIDGDYVITAGELTDFVQAHAAKRTGRDEPEALSLDRPLTFTSAGLDRQVILDVRAGRPMTDGVVERLLYRPSMQEDAERWLFVSDLGPGSPTKSVPLAEIVMRPHPSATRPMRIFLPVSASQPVYVYKTSLGSEGNRNVLGEVLSGSEPNPAMGAARADTYSAYLDGTAKVGEPNGMVPFNQRHLGRMLTLGVDVGWQPHPAWGRVTTDERAATVGELQAQQDAIADELDSRYGRWWHDLGLGVAVRTNPVLRARHLQFEGKLQYAMSLKTVPIRGGYANPSTLRIWAGAGWSNYLGSRSWLMSVTAGAGWIPIWASRTEPERGALVKDLMPFFGYVSLHPRFDPPGTSVAPIVGIEISSMLDVIPLQEGPGSGNVTRRHYLGARVAFTFDFEQGKLR